MAKHEIMEPKMQTSRPSLVARDDTFFGVCEALGRDFGFHPNWLRVAMAPLLFLAPVATICGYFGLGIVIAATRWLFPDRRQVQPVTVVETAAAEPAVETAEAEPMPLAA